MLEKGYVSTLREAFAKYIARGGPAYVDRKKMTPTGAVEAILKADGLPFLAHPADLDNLESFLTGLESAGLVGMEVYYGTYPADTIARLESVAASHNLIPSGGSDYHGLDQTIGSEMGRSDIPRDALERLISLGREKGW
jgi:predicted metal-dependent phosphoesterase TrpH